MNADDEALARLRAADPAREASTDLAALRRAVELRTAADDAASVPTDDERAVEQAHERDELAARRARRGRRRAWLAGAAASLVVGTGGYLAGVGTAAPTADSAGGGADAAYEGAVPNSAADGSAGGAAEESAGGATEDGVAGAGDADIMIAWDRAVFTSSGLSDEPGSAEAFGYDATAVDPASTVADLAAALGIEGEAVDQGWSWTVQGGDGRTIEVHPDGTGSVGYNDPTVDPWLCTEEGRDQPVPDSGGDEGDGTSSSFAGCPEDGTGHPDPAGAARDFLTTLGVDTAGLEIVTSEVGGGVTAVEASLPELVGSGAPEWNLMVGADGVYSAWGRLAPRVSLGSYDVISAEDAVERLMDPRFGPGHPTGPVDGGGVTILDDGGSVSDPVSPEVPSAPAPVAPGADIPWPVSAYEITDAELGLAGYTLPEGAYVLLPTWSLSSPDGLTWSVLALADDALDFDAR